MLYQFNIIINIRLYSMCTVCKSAYLIDMMLCTVSRSCILHGIFLVKFIIKLFSLHINVKIWIHIVITPVDVN